MLKQLAGKRAMVTGGSRGIGREICRRLVEEGVEVAFCGRQEAHVREAEEALGGIKSGAGQSIYAIPRQLRPGLPRPGTVLAVWTFW